MATQFEIECAIMAGRAYQSNRRILNWFPAGINDWSEYFHVPSETYPTSSGFEAVSFQRDNEIVISFAGTDRKDFGGDMLANVGLYIGWGSIQLKQAAAYYLEVKATNPDPDAVITFTGHSLGGGLAALMGVFFDVRAVTFDEAPFSKSATMSIRDDIVNYLVNEEHYTTDQLNQLAPGLMSFTGDDLAARMSNVSNQYVDGELIAANWPNQRIGDQEVISHGTTSVDSSDLHSQSLLAAFLAKDDFREVTYKLTNLLEMLFDKKLYARPTDGIYENFLERLVRHEFGNAPDVGQADAMLTRFTNDLWKIAQDGGLSLTNADIANTLTAFAMQMYYEKASATDPNKTLFDTIGVAAGGLHFDRGDVASTLTDAKGYDRYFKNYLAAMPGNETGIVTKQMAQLLDWYIQAGSQAMTATAGAQSVFMLGGDNGDTLTGSANADLLYGGAGADTLTGGEGADTVLGGSGDDVLNGGLGHDSYVYVIGDGNDDIVDEDKDGEIVLLMSGTERRMALNNFFESGQDEWKLLDGSAIKMTHNSLYTIVFSDGGTIDFGADFQSGDFGINLLEIPDAPVIGNTILGDQNPSDYNDSLSDTAGNDRIEGLSGDDDINAYNGGSDWLLGGDGGDVINSLWHEGMDIIEGGTGSDLLSGGQGNDKVFGDSYGEMETSIAAGETAASINERGDLISGGTGNDFVYGANRNDALFGGEGHDLLVGGGGGDALFGDDEYGMATRAWSFTINPGLNVSFDNVAVEFGTFQGDDLIYAGTGNDFVYAGGGGDEVYGGDGDDTVIGEAGDDFVEGGAGNDILEGDASWIAIAEQGNDYIDGGSGADKIWGGGGSDDLFGGTENDEIYGDSGDAGDAGDYIDGESGNDILFGIGGNDTIYGGAGSDYIDGDNGAAGAGDDYIDGEEDDDTIYGGAGSDEIYGGAGNDYIQGDNLVAGDDYLDGGAGNDTIIGVGGSDEIYGGEGDDTLHGDESNIALSDQGDDYIYGEAGNDVLVGYAGNDVLDGGADIDQMWGGAGNDELYGGDGSDTIVGDNGDGTASGDDYIDGGAGDDMIYAEGGDDSVFGGVDNDQISGGIGNDYIDGGAGVDIMVGGVGNDTYIVDDAGDAVYEYYDEGIDMIETSISRILSTNVEKLTLTGEVAIDGWGNELDNMLIGNSAANVLYGDAGEGFGGLGNDYLDGGAGADTLIGGIGDDTYVVDDPGDLIVEKADEGTDSVISSIDYVLSAALENLTLSGTAVSGAGNELNNVLVGNDTNNVLDGGAGTDQMAGGLGDDTYYVDNSGDTIFEGGGVLPTVIRSESVFIGCDEDGTLLYEQATAMSDSGGEGNDSVFSAVTFTLPDNVENLTLAGSSALDGTGNSGDNTIVGNSGKNTLNGGDGNDYLDGGAGVDKMIGGTGNDTYVVDNSRDRVAEIAGGGIDTVMSSIDYKLGKYMENLTLSGNNVINGSGNTLNNILTGNGAANTLTGGGGDDTLEGGADADYLEGAKGNDTYLYRKTDGIDTIDDLSRIEGESDTVRMTDSDRTTPVIVKDGNDLYLFVDNQNYMRVWNQYRNTNYGVERLEVTDGYYITRQDIENIVNTMSSINNDPGLDVIQKFNAMRQDQTYISTLAQSWHQA